MHAGTRNFEKAREKRTPDEQLADTLSEFYADPLGYVMFCFPWDTEQSIQQVPLPKKYKGRFDSQWGPDEWACAFLDEWAEEIKARGFDGKNAVQPIQFATASGHGIGKSVLVAWICHFIKDTRPFCKGTVTANTAEQLRGKTWAEVGKWHNLSLTKEWFTYSSGRGAMALRHKKYPQEWKIEAQTCREENSEAFAGQHAANSTSFYVFDEASGVPDKIYEVREGGTTDGEPMVFDFGNPTRNSGRFYEHCRGRFKHRYNVRAIDSRSVAITNKERIQQWVDDYGIDSDFVKVRVLGQFPSAGSLQFMSSEQVKLAMDREIAQDRHAPLVIGVDVARFGDDETVILPRLGFDCRSFPARRYKGIDTVQTTNRVIECINDFRSMGIEPSAVFVDGGGVGGGVIDQLNSLGHNVQEVQFGGGATDTKTYRFKSDEMWGNLRKAVPKLALPRMADPNGTDLLTQLTQREYGYTLAGNKIHLESKKDMKDRLGSDNGSPDIADALALTFASEVAPVRLAHGEQMEPMVAKSEYDPLEARD